ncbi:hypothetical protein Leryth_019619 [Lithospermum erythrorhizon]|nr:hypothetical protein Leryth_019619 [Lithospermum erythrorhizon]
MSNNLQQVELDSLESDPSQRLVRFMCSFGGKILPRPHDNHLRYVGGDTRIVAVNRHSSFMSLMSKLSMLSSTTDINVKYQLPTEDLDSLITVSSDEDVENMMEEYDRLVLSQKSARLRLFLFPNDPGSYNGSRPGSISSFLDGSSKREQWFLDALNAGSGLERGRSEVSSIVSEVPDYLFGLDNSDEPVHRESKLRNHTNVVSENVSVSDPGSPAPVTHSPFCSTSSAMSAPNINVMVNLPKVRTKPENPYSVVESRESTPVEMSVGSTEPVMFTQSGYAGNPMWNYTGQPGPVYYVHNQVQPGSNIPIQPVSIQTPYVQPYPLAPGQVPSRYSHQMPGGIRQVYGGIRPNVHMEQHETSAREISSDGGNQMYYGVRNAQMVPTYQRVMPMVSSMEELQRSGTENRSGRASPAP